MKFYVAKKMSKKNKEYIALFCDTGYRVIAITFDMLVISEITNKSIGELNQLAIGEVINIS